jgi:hypothetical protein
MDKNITLQQPSKEKIDLRLWQYGQTTKFNIVMTGIIVADCFKLIYKH